MYAPKNSYVKLMFIWIKVEKVLITQAEHKLKRILFGIIYTQVYSI